MPVKTGLSSILTTRFDFGVPLEDVFPPNDIHPRLKYLFIKAYESYVETQVNIESILRHYNGPLGERLKLKERLVVDLDYHIDVEDFYPGSYFWIIRHFLGLLPIPLLSSYSKGVEFDWLGLAEECKLFMQSYNREKVKKHSLDREIAQTLNMLPFENYILLNVLIVFIRKICIKDYTGRQIINKKAMLFLAKFYGPSIFTRPFRPGFTFKSDVYVPFFLYLILRWKKICKHSQIIGHPAHFLECDLKNIENYKSMGQRDNFTQTNIFNNAFFNPEVITVCRNIPYFVSNNYLKDIACQTESDISNSELNVEKKLIEPEKIVNDSEEIPPNELGKVSEKVYQLTYIEDQPIDISKIDPVLEEDNTLYQTAPNITFKSALEEPENEDWTKVVKDTLDIVKKVEDSYIYDDYETFKKEGFNQIAKKASRSSSFIKQFTKYGWTYTPPKKSPRDKIPQFSTPNKISPESDSSYVKYPDVDDVVNDDGYQKQRQTVVDPHSPKIIFDQAQQKKDKLPKASRNLFNEPSPNVFEDVSKNNSQKDLEKGQKRKRKYVLKRIRMSLEFLRALTPKKSSFKKIGSKVKYRRIRNGGKGSTI